MRVVAYSIKDYEKQQLAKANAKVHDLTLISNVMEFKTLHYCKGKEVVIISDEDFIDEKILNRLNKFGIKKIITRSETFDEKLLKAAQSINISVAIIPIKDITPNIISKDITPIIEEQKSLDINNDKLNICCSNCGVKIVELAVK